MKEIKYRSRHSEKFSIGWKKKKKKQTYVLNKVAD